MGLLVHGHVQGKQAARSKHRMCGWKTKARLKGIKERMKATQGKKGIVVLILLALNINRAVGTQITIFWVHKSQLAATI